MKIAWKSETDRSLMNWLIKYLLGAFHILNTLLVNVLKNSAMNERVDPSPQGAYGLVGADREITM